MIKPILFNTEMVRAILEGKKTATRRVIKTPPHPNMPDNHNYCRMPLWVQIGKNEYGFKTLHYMDVIEQEPFKQIRYFKSFAPYEKGDILYVRETWCSGYDGEAYFYLADKNTRREQSRLMDYDNCRWRPSIHMPKQAARIWLNVTDVRVERLQDMTEEQAIKEGISCVKYDVNTGKEESAALDWFPILWDSTVKKSDINIYGWDANPWVWVIEFERCEKPDPCILNGMEPAEDKRPCIGYQKSEWDDEPCEMCKECKWCNGGNSEDG